MKKKKKPCIPAGRSELAPFLHWLTVSLLKMNLDVRHAPGTEPKHHRFLSANAFNTVWLRCLFVLLFYLFYEVLCSSSWPWAPSDPPASTSSVLRRQVRPPQPFMLTWAPCEVGEHLHPSHTVWLFLFGWLALVLARQGLAAVSSRLSCLLCHQAQLVFVILSLVFSIQHGFLDPVCEYLYWNCTEVIC